jgi:glycosyl hydrolase family 9
MVLAHVVYRLYCRSAGVRPAGAIPTIIVNHLGYNTAAPKSAVLAAPSPAPASGVRLVPAAGDPVPLAAAEPVRVPGWRTAWYQRIDFEAAPGTWRIEAEVAGAAVRSEPFVVGDHQTLLVVSDVTAYFRSVRSYGEIDRKDAHARFYGDDSGREVDARGGWLDASGDFSKFLSHLTYTRMMSPQQIPLCAWAMLTAGRRLAGAHPGFATNQHALLRDEGLFGADFLVRFQDPAGFFYTGIFDALTKNLDERVINAPLQDSVRTQRWQAAYRHGGGLAIATLALASTMDDHGEYGAGTYFAAAARGFEHLEEHNTEYSFDGQESVLDDYCALLAATELLAAAHGRPSERYSAAAARRATSLIDRYRTDEAGIGYLVGDVAGRPYFHAAESGLPVIALLRYAEVTGDAKARAMALTLLDATVQRIDAVPNPFGYLRQRVQPGDGTPRDAFFFPHDNETGYWWQGENANLGSVAYAASLGAAAPGCPPELRDRLRRLAADLLGWVLGRNPFDSCMLQGRGRNTEEYRGPFQNSPGGILNGITSGFTDEDDIAFMPDNATRADQWRWVEQWIPHTGWFVLAVCASA